MPVDTKRLGYGGSASIAGQQVLVTSASFMKEISPSYLEPWSIPASSTSRSRVLHADGVSSYSGSLSLDVTDNFLSVLDTSTLLSRRYSFSVGIHDGEEGYKMDNCYVTSLSLNGATGGLITASLSFVSAEPWESSLTVPNDFIRDDEPVGYWYSGNTDVREWSFTMNQNATPMYGNENSPSPKYIKVGMVNYGLQVLTFDSIVSHSAISIKTSSFTLTGVTTSEEYSFVGVNDFGNYRHSFETAANATTGSGGIIIS